MKAQWGGGLGAFSQLAFFFWAGGWIPCRLTGVGKCYTLRNFVQFAKLRKIATLRNIVQFAKLRKIATLRHIVQFAKLRKIARLCNFSTQRFDDFGFL